MISQQQEAELTGGGDCFSHWHSNDRVLDHGSLQQLQQTVRETSVSTTPYAVTDSDDILLVDTAGSSITVNLPRARNGRELYLIKLVAANTMTLQPSGTDTINGAASVAVTIQWTSIKIKAISTGWIVLSRYL